MSLNTTSVDKKSDYSEQSLKYKTTGLHPHPSCLHQHYTHTQYFNLHPDTYYRKVPEIPAGTLHNFDSGFWFLCLN